MFGAHLFSQFLLAFGIEEKFIKSILDNDVEKQGRRLQGCNLYCESPNILKDSKKSPIVILRAGTYQEEIKQGLLNINPNTIIWE